MSEAHGIELGTAIYGHADPTNWVDGGSSLTGDELSKTFDRDADLADVTEPVGAALAKAQRDALSKGSVDPSWSELIGTVAKSASVVERQVDGEWRTFIYDGGKLVEQSAEKLFSVD
jgi:hypothetical protein